MMYTYSTRAGEVVFYITIYAGCCGIDILSNVRFFPNGKHPSTLKKNKEILFNKFNSYIKSRRLPVGPSLVLMADRHNGPMAEFCKAMKWRKFEGFVNAQTGNRLSLYGLVRN